MNNVPCIFLAFANDFADKSRFLKNLNKEAEKIFHSLRSLEVIGKIEIIVRRNASLDDLFDVFQHSDYRDRISVFHYGGHANANQLLLESNHGQVESANAQGLATLLGSQSNLQLAFLNGCSTAYHAHHLLEAKVPSVIATSQLVDDVVAMQFATRFYTGLAKGATIQQAYTESKADVVARYEGQFRFGPENNEHFISDKSLEAVPWKLYVNEDDNEINNWHLPKIDESTKDIECNYTKLTMPRSVNIYSRKLMFHQLDQNSHSNVLWVSSPAGSGKTALISSYLQERNIRPQWYRMDEGDNEITSFFSYLEQLARSTFTKKDINFPPINLKNKLCLLAFARKFFRLLFASMNTSGVLVFDNYQEIDEHSPLHDLLLAGLQEIPEHIKVIVISREKPPASFVKLRISNQLTEIGWEQVQFSSVESKFIAQTYGSELDITESTLQQICETANGWVTGLILLLEQAKSCQLPSNILDGQTCQMIFDYFTEVIFSKVSIEVKDFLLRTAFLPNISPDIANQIAGTADGEQILEYLHMKNCFILKNKNAVIYEYHPLFSNYLRAMVNKKFYKS